MLEEPTTEKDSVEHQNSECYYALEEYPCEACIAQQWHFAELDTSEMIALEWTETEVERLQALVRLREPHHITVDTDNVYYVDSLFGHEGESGIDKLKRMLRAEKEES